MDVDLLDILRKREAELLPDIERLRETLRPLECELDVVRQAIVGLGGVRTIKELALDYLKDQPDGATSKQIAMALELASATVRPQLHRLKAAGALTNQNKKWFVSSEKT